MRTEVNGEGETIVIRLHGKFTFEARAAFDAAMKSAFIRKSQAIQLDLSGIECINSAGLGMLLVLQKKARNSGKAVSLARCPGTVRETIETAYLRSLFGMA